MGQIPAKTTRSQNGVSMIIVGPASQTVTQQWNNIQRTSLICWVMRARALTSAVINADCSSCFNETRRFPPPPPHSYRFNIVGILCDREIACSDSDHQGLNFESRPIPRRPGHTDRHFMNKASKNDTLPTYQKTRVPWNCDEYIECLLTLTLFSWRNLLPFTVELFHLCVRALWRQKMRWIGL